MAKKNDITPTSSQGTGAIQPNNPFASNGTPSVPPQAGASPSAVVPPTQPPAGSGSPAGNLGTVNGGGAGTPPPSPDAPPSPNRVEPGQPDLEAETELFKKLSGRKPYEIKVSDAEQEAIVNHVIRDFEDNSGGNRQFLKHMTEMLANWRGIVEEKDFPFEGCSNVTVPLTSVLVETMKSRMHKAILGGEYPSKISFVDKQLPNDQLDETNRWFKWELDEVVEFGQKFDEILHQVLVYGLSLPVASYDHEDRYLHSWKEWELDKNSILSQLIDAGLEEIVNEPSTWGDEQQIEVIKEDKPAGQYKLNDGGRIEFSINVERNTLRADIWRKETLFDGVRLNLVNLEDLFVPNTDADLNLIPFLGIRCWYSIAQYRQKLEQGFFIDHGAQTNQRIAESMDYGKIPDEFGRDQSDFQDEETGTDSADTTASSPTHYFGEVYRWEGWWVWDKSGGDYGVDKLLQPATQVAVWVAVRAKKLLKICRIEDLNKDAKRSGVKLEFIREPGRFFPMGLAEWVRHMQAELDAVHNLRIDAGILSNVPYGFYKPASGLGKEAQPIKVEPGKWFPVADPQGINSPRMNWQPTVSFAEENLIVKYANLQAGLTDPALGQAPSKRQSASEYIGNANAIDTRSEDIIRGLVSSLKCLFIRILGLYQQFGPRTRIFRVGGEGGVQLTKRFDRNRLHGKITLEMLASLRQLNEELQRQTAQDMIQILLNQLLIQSGIVGPDTMYAALDTLFKHAHYEGVPIHKPDLPPISDPPDVEEHQMFAGQTPTGPTMTENINEHLHHHAMVMADSQLMNHWSPEARQLLSDHYNKTLQMQQAKQIDAQQRAAMAAQMAITMNAKGIRPGMAGDEAAGGGAGGGTPAEGAQGAGESQGTGPQPPLQ